MHKSDFCRCLHRISMRRVFILLLSLCQCFTMNIRLSRAFYLQLPRTGARGCLNGIKMHSTCPSPDLISQGGRSRDLYHSIKPICMLNSVGFLVQCPEPEAIDLDRIFSDGKDSEVYVSELDQNMVQGRKGKRLSVHIGGRIAIHRAWRSLCGGTDDAFRIMRSASGAPILPPGFIGSITHKDLLAAGVIRAGDPSKISLGVDLERTSNKAYDKLQRRLLTDRERESVGRVNTLPEEVDIMLRFSFKEAIYKALNPWLGRYIEFLEAEVFPTDEGGGEVVLNLKQEDSKLFHCTPSWQRFDNYVLTMVRIDKV